MRPELEHEVIHAFAVDQTMTEDDVWKCIDGVLTVKVWNLFDILYKLKVIEINFDIN